MSGGRIYAPRPVVVGAAEIVKGIAESVFQPAPVPPGYVEKNMYISSIMKKKPGRSGGYT
ncbi:MAG TPA: hypothetical protein VGI39_44040 [Polyangiaceae bacterium]|jgi:hypothetical protein